MTLLEWRTFAASLHIETKYPGINGIGIIHRVAPEDLVNHVEDQQVLRPDYRVHPEHLGIDHFPIVFIEPEGPNAKAIGLDMAHETSRYAAARRARDTGAAQFTAPIVLVQDEGHTPGFLFYVPYYVGRGHASLEDRRANFVGMVYAPFVVEELMAGTLEKEKRRVGITIADDNDTIYDENVPVEDDFDDDPLYAETIELHLYGRTWVFTIQSTRSFRASTASIQPTIILFGGITIDILLLTMFVMLSRASRRTLSFADRTTSELRRKAKALAKSNAELESFAYIASHDLKTPLRGITDLAAYLEEDLKPYTAAPGCNPDVPRNLQRIHQQTNRMEKLIRGIMDYSGVGAHEGSVEEVHVVELLQSIRSQLQLRESQIVVQGTIPLLYTYRVRFEQVMTNLVSNAFKYNPDRENANVTVSCKARGGFHEFSVTDNGPGIDPKFHSRIFEVFQTLQSKDEIEGSGVGLSIVKKSVEALGGTVRITSALGQGTTFHFEWPITIRAQPASDYAVK